MASATLAFTGLDDAIHKAVSAHMSGRVASGGRAGRASEAGAHAIRGFTDVNALSNRDHLRVQGRWAPLYAPGRGEGRLLRGSGSVEKEAQP